MVKLSPQKRMEIFTMPWLPANRSSLAWFLEVAMRWNRSLSLPAAALLAVLLVPLAASQKDNRAEVLFESARKKAFLEGNLQAALEQYKKIVADYGGNRSIAAKALVEIGRCYEKLGLAEAQKAYEQVLRDYADQPEQVTLARERLAALRGASRAVGTDLAVRKVWAEPLTDTQGAPSPDGRYFSFVDWTTGDLAIRDLETGKNRRLTNKGAWQQSKDFALFSRWSPDGKQLAYDWYLADPPSAPPADHNELRIIKLEDAQPRILYREKDVWVVTCDWSPDGKEILAFCDRGVGQERQLVAIAVADGSVRVIKRLGRPTAAWSYHFSPDGRYILCSYAPGEESTQIDLFLLSADGKRETQVEHPAMDTAMGWSRDGKWALFLSDRTGSLDLWALPVAEGKPRGEPRLVKPSLGRVDPLGVTRDGSFFYGYSPQVLDVYVARLDPGTGAVLTPPAKVVQQFEGANDWPSYSPDGKQLAYVSARRSVTLLRPRFNVLCVRSVDTGKEKEFSTGFERLAGTRWSPDGRALFVAGWDAQGALGIYRVDAERGTVTPVVEKVKFPPATLRAHEVSGDGKVLYYVRLDQPGGCRVIAHDLAGGKERDLYREPGGGCVNIALSPDGGRLALLNLPRQTDGDRIIKVMPSGGGEPKEIFRFPQFGMNWIPLVWTAGGQHLLFPRQKQPSGVSPTWSLWRVPAAGGEAQNLGLEMSGIGSLTAHPDGQRIALASAGPEVRDGEVWVMENFLPEAKAGQR
jgi:Tol biopolymer transport system component